MDYCNVYVNERSAACQLPDVISSETAIKTLLDCLDVVDGCDAASVTVKKYYGNGLYSAMLSNSVTIDTLRDKDLKRRVKLSLRDAGCWDKMSLTDANATYLHQGRDVTMTSMSESYEQASPILVNFVLSGIGEPVAVIEKKGSTTVAVDAFSNTSMLLAFVIAKGWRRSQYDLTSNIPPHDEESILSDLSRFEPTEFRYKGRIMYRRKGTGHLCYIDSKHFGKAAHIEEFNEATKEMLGTLKINEDVEHHPITTNEKVRKLKLDK